MNTITNAQLNDLNKVIATLFNANIEYFNTQIEANIMQYIQETVCEMANKIVEHFDIFNKESLTTEEACIYLNMSEHQLHKLTSKKQIKYSKPGGKNMFFKREDLDEYMRRNTQMTEDEINDQVQERVKLLSRKHIKQLPK